jgi:hypothetical protein
MFLQHVRIVWRYSGLHEFEMLQFEAFPLLVGWAARN